MHARLAHPCGASCIALAYIYYGAVRSPLGHDAFCEGQKNACECADKR